MAFYLNSTVYDSSKYFNIVWYKYMTLQNPTQLKYIHVMVVRQQSSLVKQEKSLL